jgi:hypothetical protein
VVYAVRRRRAGDSRTKRLTAFGFYRLMGRLSSTAIPADTGDFRLMDRCVVEALGQLPERSRFMKGLFAWVGFRQTAITYDRDARAKGQSGWNYWKLWNFALDGITSFSRVPLQVLSGGGLLIACLALLYGAWMVLRTLVFGIDLPGYASLMTAVLFLGGVQLLGLGVLGEYLGRVFEEVKRRPLYLVRERWRQDNGLNSAKTAVLAGSTSKAASPAASSVPEPRLVSTGVPQAMASNTGRPKPSHRLGYTRANAPW